MRRDINEELNRVFSRALLIGAIVIGVTGAAAFAETAFGASRAAAADRAMHTEVDAQITVTGSWPILTAADRQAARRLSLRTEAILISRLPAKGSVTATCLPGRVSSRQRCSTFQTDGDLTRTWAVAIYEDGSTRVELRGTLIPPAVSPGS